jgi:tRNA (mo5U34)-methyltransferase
VSMRNRSLADVGAWNGCFTVEARRRGASPILAIDEYTWAHPGFRGKEGFDLVMQRLGIEVETRLADIQSINADTIGQWQVVLFLGVFYHLLDPIAALRRLAEVTAEVLVVETHLDLQDLPTPAMVFYPGSELGGDPTNWWGPNRAAVDALLKVVGFPKVLFTPNPLAPQARGIFHAFKSEALYHEHAAAADQGGSRSAEGSARLPQDQ